MGIYHIKCPVCKEPCVWFSGSMDQRCELCKIEKMNIPENPELDKILEVDDTGSKPLSKEDK